MKVQPHQPLQIYVQQLTQLFQQALTSRNPALFLYHHDARTPLFMAESLLRLLSRIYLDVEIEGSLKQVKKLEDMLGAIEDQDELLKRFSRKGVPAKQLDHFAVKRDKALMKLNERLLRRNFYQEEFNELLQEFKIDLADKKLVSRLETEMRSEIDICAGFYNQFPKKFTSMEGQVHEIRRKLRWISIYGQSLHGLVALAPTKKHEDWEKKFITKNELRSPYNKLIVNRNLNKHIELNREAFYATSFVISELGKIKDKGLAIEALAKAIKKTGKAGNAQKQAIKELKVNYTEKDLLGKAHKLLHKYFVKYKIHAELVK